MLGSVFLPKDLLGIKYVTQDAYKLAILSTLIPMATWRVFCVAPGTLPGLRILTFHTAPRERKQESGIGSDWPPAYRWGLAGLRFEPRSFCLQSIAHSHCPRQLLLTTEKRGAWAVVLVRAGSVNVHLSPSFFHSARKATRSQTTPAVAALPLPRKSPCASVSRRQIRRWHVHAATAPCPLSFPSHYTLAFVRILFCALSGNSLNR